MSNIVVSGRCVINVDEITCATERTYLEITFKDGSVRKIDGPNYIISEILQKIANALIPENTDDEG